MATTVEDDTDNEDRPNRRRADTRSSTKHNDANRGRRADDRQPSAPSATEPSTESTYRLKGDPSGPVRVDRGSAESVRSTRSKDARAGRSGDQARPTTLRGLRRLSADPRRRDRSRVRSATGSKADRIGGVAPWVTPRARLGRRRRLRELTSRGFVPLSPGRTKLRHRILPRSVIGIAFALLSAGIGAAFSGAAFYAYYDDRLAENERTVARFVEGFDQQFTDASGALDEMRVEAVGTIRAELEPLTDFVDAANGVVGLPATAGPSVWLVETRGDEGQVVTGSAFAVVGHEGGTAMITSYAVVRAATIEPGPAVELLKGDRRIVAEVWSWDEASDLALLVVDEEIPALPLAGDQAQIDAVGRQVFVLGGFGGQGASASPGVLIDHSSVGLQHTAPIGTLYNGAPLLDGGGRVLGMASLGYAPLGVEPGAVGQSPDVASICASLLLCSQVDQTVELDVAD